MSNRPFFVPSEQEQFVEAFKAMADPIRMKIIQLLWRPEAKCCSVQDRICACDLEEMLGISQSTVSHHMKILVRAGLVIAAKEGRWIYYTVNRYSFAALSGLVTKYAEEMPADAPRAKSAAPARRSRGEPVTPANARSGRRSGTTRGSH
jgi:ArsR family transcriptional regulator